MDTADTHAVGLKLPVFWADHPRVWLQQAEAQFAVRNVTADNTKYHYVVAALDQATALRVIDVLEEPPQHNKYDNLKQRLTDLFGLSRRQRVDQLLDIGLHSLSDRRPSQLMDEMLALLGLHKPCMLFESIFLRCMPEDIRLQLATSSFDDLRAIAKTADEFWQAKEQSAVVFASNTLTKRSATRKPATTNSSSETPARDRDVCFYHQRFGDAARKCVQPCAFAGNDRAGRQWSLWLGGGTNSLLFLVDGHSDKRFLVDTGVVVSVYPASFRDIHGGSHTRSLVAANGSNIAMYGTRRMNILLEN